MAGIFGLLMSGAGVIKDQYYNLTSLLLPGNGTNGAQNNTFLDGSSNTFTITRNGNTTQGTFSPFSQTGWGNYFDGTGDYLSAADNAAFSYGTGDFTIEFWMYPTTTGATKRLYFHQTTSTTQFSITQLSANTINVFANNSSTTIIDITGSTAVSANTWTHVAVVRNGSTFTLYQNGTSVASGTSSASMPDPTGSLYIGALDTGSDPYTGYLSNYRIVKGTAVYTSAFTPPTAPLTAITNTSLLTCQSNRFRDASANSFPLTVNGNPSVTPFSPFAPTQSYSASAVGGSGYFDGTGDYLTAPDNAAFDLPGDFTIEMWVYASVSPGATKSFINHADAASTGWAFGFNGTGTNLFWYTNSSFILNTSSGLVLNAWNHVAAVRSGTSLVIYINGTSAGSVTNSTSYAGTGLLYVGSDQYSQSFTGTLSGVRIVKGQALASGNFTPPSAPVTTSTVGWTGANAAGSLTGTVSLLLNFTNAGVVDATAKNVLETVGNAQISTTQSKWGGSSISFDGTGDWLLIPDQPQQRIGTGNFTIEMWVYRNASGTYGLVGKGTGTTGWLVSLNSSNQVVFTYGSSTITSTGTVSATTWTYIAVVREGTGTNQTKIYINGTNDGTGTVNTDFNQTNSMYIGADRTGGSAANAYVQDVRITNYARTITASPTAPFALQ